MKSHKYPKFNIKWRRLDPPPIKKKKLFIEHFQIYAFQKQTKSANIVGNQYSIYLQMIKA